MLLHGLLGNDCILLIFFCFWEFWNLGWQRSNVKQQHLTNYYCESVGKLLSLYTFGRQGATLTFILKSCLLGVHLMNHSLLHILYIIFCLPEHVCCVGCKTQIMSSMSLIYVNSNCWGDLLLISLLHLNWVLFALDTPGSYHFPHSRFQCLHACLPSISPCVSEGEAVSNRTSL